MDKMTGQSQDYVLAIYDDGRPQTVIMGWLSNSRVRFEGQDGPILSTIKHTKKGDEKIVGHFGTKSATAENRAVEQCWSILSPCEIQYDFPNEPFEGPSALRNTLCAGDIIITDQTHDANRFTTNRYYRIKYTALTHTHTPQGSFFYLMKDSLRFATQ